MEYSMIYKATNHMKAILLMAFIKVGVSPLDIRDSSKMEKDKDMEYMRNLLIKNRA